MMAAITNLVSLALFILCVNHASTFDLFGCKSIAVSPLDSICNVCSVSRQQSPLSYCNASVEVRDGQNDVISVKSLNDTRCCIKHDCSVGLDLRNCHIVPAFANKVLKESKFSFSISESNKDCLGNDFAWSQISKYGHIKICSKPIRLCTNVTCPENSHCVNNGTSFECRCDDGWHGYKCLRYGTFPSVTWLVSIGASTFAIIITTWSFQKYSYIKNRRHQRSFGTQ